jgi:putative spermidine/putrescine transport system substrate-binding protein
MASFLPNGPARTSSLDLLPADVLTQVPNGPAYEDKLYIVSDAEWWSRNHAALEEAFRAWLEAPVRHGAAGSTR